MRITNQGITAITGALEWADIASHNRTRPFQLDDVVIAQHKGAGETEFVIVIDVRDDHDTDIIGTGATFNDAASAFYTACKRAAEAVL